MTDETIPLDDIVELARAGRLRVRAFGETVMWGNGRVWAGRNMEDTLDALAAALVDGVLRIYTDRDGVFVGPPDPFYVEHTPTCGARDGRFH